MRKAIPAVAALVLGATLYFATWWWKGAITGADYHWYANALNDVLPGLIVGFLLPRLAPVSGLLVGLLGMAFVEAYIHFFTPYTFELSGFARATIESCVYASVSACGGGYVRGAVSNNSFKPKPLRGSA